MSSQQQTGGTALQTPAADRGLYYLCERCDNRVELRKGELIRCKACGSRVLYKERTKSRMVQFEAR
ncbi:hypothetical protein P152DRAFT_387913 [Eremomyces bilateralis CBS 781.70]|uniref:Metallothionein-I gene transcription activator n=1 Tax=Eremomyces bilateralis CBS 781.70 TaxID=1392243 RepID=A0A6G1GG97_9PEZI|nr:uncharacterized protein P152DRAFT_387913 [Eremomyces bilateralis CBS 781.70]KAF1817073.1 hypothetical protein P152DRAFT_387913 [Eremomyces bilateralis CBS 781.70]